MQQQQHNHAFGMANCKSQLAAGRVIKRRTDWFKDPRVISPILTTLL